MNQPQSILIVEDEEAIRVGLTDVLIYHGYNVDYADDGLTGLEKALTGNFDLILLDVMLPNMNGFDICSKIREKNKTQAIIMLTAKADDEDIINGLTLGADDYVAKPFSITQLVLRIKAVLRRSSDSNVISNSIPLNENIKIDTQNLCLHGAPNPVTFAKREIELLEYLYQNRHRAVSREELLSEIWGYSKELQIETRTVDIHIARIRRKIETNAKSPQYLVTVRGAGYRLNTSGEVE